jgi:PadR family transcriptional regulator, regulatory protein PadR
LRRKGSVLDCVLPFRTGAVDDLDVNLLRGTLDLLILKALSWGPRHGYAVVEWIEQATDAGFLIGEGTLYPALHRLERRGWITAEWGVSDNNRQAKYYRLARTGRARLQAGSSAWHRFVEVAGRALSLTEPVPT